MPGARVEFGDIMIDIETLGNLPGCAIVSVGAIAFNEFGLHDQGFKRVVNVPDWDKAGLTADKLWKSTRTIGWWQEQSEEARSVFSQPGQSTKAVLSDLARYINNFGKPRVWGNGADFDLPIIKVAADIVGLDPDALWLPYNGRCYRTVKNQFKDVRVERTGTHHDALDDAVYQADHLVAICQARDWRLA